MIRKNNLYLLGTITLIGFPLIGFLINYLFGSPLSLDILRFSDHDAYFILAGLLFGVSVALVGERISEIPFISKSTFDLTEFLKNLRLNYFDIFFLSFAAGFGEEILFRASIQEFLGIWPTSIIFIAIHGYLDFRKPGIFIFGVYLTFFSAFLGYMYETYGLWSAVAIHFAYDFLLLLSLKRASQ